MTTPTFSDRVWSCIIIIAQVEGYFIVKLQFPPGTQATRNIGPRDVMKLRWDMLTFLLCLQVAGTWQVSRGVYLINEVSVLSPHYVLN